MVPCSLADGRNGLWETDNIVGNNNLCREGPADPCSRSEAQARRWQVQQQQLEDGRSNTKSLVAEAPAKSKGSRKGAVGAPERNAMCWAAATATPPTVADTQGQQLAPNILGAAGTTWLPLAPDNDQQQRTPQGLHITLHASINRSTHIVMLSRILITYGKYDHLLNANSNVLSLTINLS